MEREPDLAALRALTLVAEAGSISAASATLGLSQQAVSLRIRSLESELHVPLLVRSARGSQLTEAGELVVGWARPLLAAATEFRAAATALKPGPAETLRIAASLTIAEHLLPGWIARWRVAAGAGASARLTAANSAAVIAAVRAHTADLGFVETPDVPAGLTSTVIGYDEIAVVAAVNHPWAAREVAAAEVASTPLVLREPGSGTRLAFERALARAGTAAPAGPAAVYETTLGVRSAVMAGLAPGALSVLAVRDDIAAGRLARVRVPGLDAGRPLSAVWLGADPTRESSALLREIARAVNARPAGVE